jgi:hypothetical protein
MNEIEKLLKLLELFSQESDNNCKEESEDTPEFKNGDFVYFETDRGSSCIGIIRKHQDDRYYLHCCYNYDHDKFLKDGYIDKPKQLLAATSAEKLVLNYKIAKNGFTWDEKNLNLIKKSERVKPGDTYYVLRFVPVIEGHTEFDNENYKNHNYFIDRDSAVNSIKEFLNKNKH